LDRACADKTPVTLRFKRTITEQAHTCSVAGTMPGREKAEVLFMAHADTNYNTVGAHDNTASLITMLMLAHTLSGTQPRYTFTFLATSAEEVGSYGAQHYVRARKEQGTLGNIKLFVNFDSLTYGPDLQLQTLDASFQDLLIRISSDLAIQGTPKAIVQAPDIDGEPFAREGVRGININSRGYTWTLPLWHRPEDTAEKIPSELVENNFLVFSEFIRRIQQENV